MCHKMVVLLPSMSMCMGHECSRGNGSRKRRASPPGPSRERPAGWECSARLQRGQPWQGHALSSNSPPWACVANAGRPGRMP